MSVIQAGEALGHGFWVDVVFLEQVISAREKVKSRMGHPGLSGDALGIQIGSTSRFRLGDNADRVVGDLTFFAEANRDQVERVRALAREAPEQLGASIVFYPDYNAVEDFRDENLNSDGEFESPDTDNFENLPHMRLKKLHAVDLVDDPAANRDGLSTTTDDEFAHECDKALSFGFGLSDESPDTSTIGIHPDRIRAFCADWLSRNAQNLDIGGVKMPAENVEKPTLSWDDITTESLAEHKPTLLNDAVDRAKVAERDRCLAITKECGNLDLSAGVAADQIACDATPEQAENAMLREKLAAKGEALNIDVGKNAEPTADNSVSFEDKCDIRAKELQQENPGLAYDRALAQASKEVK